MLEGACAVTLVEVLHELESAGTEQNRKVYRRHGVTGNSYGVSYAVLGQLQKRIKRNQPLAEQLWDTGNHDARILATMVADPDHLTRDQFGAWIREADNHVLSEAVARLAAASPQARACAVEWIESPDEWAASAGWVVWAQLAMTDREIPDETFAGLLSRIAREIHGSANRVRYGMNNALIGIGLRSDAFEALAMAAAKRIGKVEVEHGETGCKTPDALTYIPKAREHARKKQTKPGASQPQPSAKADARAPKSRAAAPKKGTTRKKPS